MKLIPTSLIKPQGDALLLTTSKVWIIGDWYEGAWRTYRSEWQTKGDKLVLISAFQEDSITHWLPLPPTHDFDDGRVPDAPPGYRHELVKINSMPKWSIKRFLGHHNAFCVSECAVVSVRLPTSAHRPHRTSVEVLVAI